MLGQTTQPPKNYDRKKKMSSKMQGVSPNDCELFTSINNMICVDPGYLRLHHKMMQANGHQIMECTSIGVGMLNTTIMLSMD